MKEKMEAKLLLKLPQDLKDRGEALGVQLDRSLSWLLREGLEQLIRAEMEKKNG